MIFLLEIGIDGTIISRHIFSGYYVDFQVIFFFISRYSNLHLTNTRGNSPGPSELLPIKLRDVPIGLHVLNILNYCAQGVSPQVIAPCWTPAIQPQVPTEVHLRKKSPLSDCSMLDPLFIQPQVPTEGQPPTLPLAALNINCSTKACPGGLEPLTSQGYLTLSH